MNIVNHLLYIPLVTHSHHVTGRRSNLSSLFYTLRRLISVRGGNICYCLIVCRLAKKLIKFSTVSRCKVKHLDIAGKLKK